MTSDPLFDAAHAAYQRQEYEAVLRMLLPQVGRLSNHESALALLANAALLCKKDETAIPLLQRMIALRPEKTDYRRILSHALDRRGTALRRTGNPDEAEQSFEDAVEAWNGNDTARFNLAVLLGHRRAFAQALPHWQSLSTRRPDDPDIGVELANCLVINERPEEAREILTRLPGTDETTASQRLRLAQIWLNAGDADNALSILADLDPKPEQARQLLELGDALAHASDIPAATRAYRMATKALDAGRQSPGLRAELSARLALPAVYAGIDDLQGHRERYRTNVIDLESSLSPETLIGFERNLSQLSRTNFFLAYQGEDDRELQSAYGGWLSRVAPSFASGIAPQPTGSGQSRARIGLVGSIFRYCTAGSYFGSWVRLLADLGYEVHVFQLGAAADPFTAALGKSATQLHHIESDLNTIAKTLADARCDLLIYPEIGMEARVLPLAALNLAPRQTCAWGHPVTTGLPNMDGYFSCAEMEPVDAASHYSEPLLLLPGLGTEYARPLLPEFAARAELGLPEDRHLYLFPHALYKLHPDNDAVMTVIAMLDPNSVFVMFRSEARAALTPFRRRLDAAFASAGIDPDHHLRILPMTSRERYLQIVHACDIMVDSLHWSGGNTSLDALVCGLPLVTCPGKYMRSRQSAAMLRRLGLTELIAETPNGLAALSVDLAASPDRRERIRHQIHQRLPVLFDTEGLSSALNDHVELLLSR